jgi:hypothetical protein
MTVIQVFFGGVNAETPGDYNMDGLLLYLLYVHRHTDTHTVLQL